MKKIISMIILVSLLAVSLPGLTTNFKADEKQINYNVEILPITSTYEDTSNFLSFDGKEYYLPPFPEKTQKQLDKMIKDPKPTVGFGDLPSQFSWLDNGGDWTTSAKNQGNCGSCWAFGALGAMEAAINIAKGDSSFDCDLSEQYTLSCLSAAGSCDGGWMSEAIEYIKSTAPGSYGNGINGCPLESCMPYTGDDWLSCSDKCEYWDYHTVPPAEDNILFQVEDFGITQINPSSSSDWDLLKTWVYTYGPIVVDIYASSGWSSFWNSHHSPTYVYEGTETGLYTNHAQVLCGWVDDDSVLNGGYWILKNSWGTSFGYSGFNNLAYGCLMLGDRDVTWVTTPSWSGVAPNRAPAKPSNPSPYDGEPDVDVNPTLSVYVYDPDGDVMDVTFYDASDNSKIETAYGIASGATASVTWSGLSYLMTYSWYAVADDGEVINTSSIWSFTTGEARFYANQDIIVQNGGITGSYVDTKNSDDGYMIIQERQSGGKPSDRYSYLEHKWIIPVTGGLQYYEFALEAHHTENLEGDDFIFAYSLNDASYTDMMTVTKTADDDSYQVYTLPTTISGNVYIRVKDNDQSQGKRNLDSILIDHMYIEGTGTPPSNRAPAKPSNPSPHDTETNVDVNPTLSVYVYDPDGDVMDVTFYDASDNSKIETAYGIASGATASVTWSGLSCLTTYNWYAISSDSVYSNKSETWSFTTRPDIPVGGVYVWDISFTSAGPHIKSTVIIRLDSDNDGLAEASDALVSDATVNYKLTHLASEEFNIYSDITDGTGAVTFLCKRAPSGTYEGLVTGVEHSIYEYVSELNVETSVEYTH